MEERASFFLVGLAAVIVLSSLVSAERPSSKHLFACGLFSAEYVLVFILSWINLTLHWSDEKYRPKSSLGLVFVFLVPLSILGNIYSVRSLRDDTSDRMNEAFLSLCVTAVVLLKYLRNSCKPELPLSFILLIPFTVTSFHLPASLSFFNGVMMWVTWKGLDAIPAMVPRSFTYGELSVVLQLFMCWLSKLIIAYSKIHLLAGDDFRLVWFQATFSVSIVSSTVLYLAVQKFSSLLCFLLIYGLHALASVGILHWQIEEQPVVWLFHFVRQTKTRVCLLILWFVISIMTITWTVLHSYSAHQQHLPQPVHYDDQLSRRATWSENSFSLKLRHSSHCEKEEKEEASDAGHSQKHVSWSIVHSDVVQLHPRVRHDTEISGNNSLVNRKVFHLLVVLVYIPGLILDQRLLSLASVSIFGIFIVLEVARAVSIPVFGHWLQEILGTFTDERDQGPIILTHIYLFTGMSLPLWLSYNTGDQSSLEQYSGVLALGIGDTVACITGKAWGKLHWPGSKKTVEGTMSSIIAQFLLLVILGEVFGCVAITSYVLLCVGITISALVEAFTDQIDNLILPLVLYPLLCIN